VEYFSVNFIAIPQHIRYACHATILVVCVHKLNYTVKICVGHIFFGKQDS